MTEPNNQKHTNNMGFYVNETTRGTPLPYNDKGSVLVSEGDAVNIDKPRSYADIPDGKAVLVEVFNDSFSALGFAYNEQQFNEFVDPMDYRPKKYFAVNREDALNLTGLLEDDTLT